MRQVFIDKSEIAVRTVCEPVLDDNLVMVSVHYSFISSGTESSTVNDAAQSSLLSNLPKKVAKVFDALKAQGIQGTRNLVQAKLAGSVCQLGYSCSGKVIAVGKNIKHIKTGDFVACAGTGYANHADIVCVPENLVVVCAEKFLQEASITTIGAIALQGIRRTAPQLGEIVCVQGLGLLGQITIQLAKLSGCTVIGIDIVPERLALAREVGADATFCATSETLLKDIAFFTDHRGVDSTLITAASKSNTLIQQAMEITRKKGKVVIVGDIGLGLERSPFYQKEIDLLMSTSYGPGRSDPIYEKEGVDYPYGYVRWTENRNMQAFISLLQSGKLTVSKLISDIIAIEHAPEAYQRLQDKKKLGIILNFTEKNSMPKFEKEILFTPARKDSLRIGFIGAGGFAQGMLMPIIAGIKNSSITAIVDPDIVTATNSSRAFTAAHALTNDLDLYKQDLADLVVIASPHKMHCDQIIAALTNNKAVFVEKPMVTTFEQLEKLMPILAKSSAPLCVDYNRSFAPFIQQIKQQILQRSTPLIIHYRMNAGYIPKEHWIQTDIGAGRIIGEACHIFDLFCFLTDAQPKSISVETLKPRAENLFSTDNFSVQISFSDGSLCTLLYTAIGHSAAGKERMEIYFDGKTIIMDDYKILEGYGLPSAFNQKVDKQDKGHENLIKNFFASVYQPNIQTVMSLERLYTVAHLTLIIDELACQGGGEKLIS